MIVFNGCSFVEQSHLELESENWKDLYWPTLVAGDHVNLALSGASNTRIWRTTIDYIHCGKPITKLCIGCLLYTSPSPRDRQKSRMPSSA